MEELDPAPAPQPASAEAASSAATMRNITKAAVLFRFVFAGINSLHFTAMLDPHFYP
jgi:hypothetical protein